MKKLIALLLTAGLVLGLSGCCMQHQWAEANCSRPKTCMKCGKTEGEALGHDWQEADCVHPKTCTRCGETEGEVLGHDWQEATCAAPKTCSRCGKTEGKALQHTPGKWEVVESDYVAGVISYEKKCTACGAQVITKEEKMTSLVKDGLFVLTPKQYLQRLAAKLNQAAEQNPSQKLVTIENKDPDSVGYELFAGEKLLAEITFVSDLSGEVQGSFIDVDNYGVSQFAMVYVEYVLDDESVENYTDEITTIQSCVILAADPQLAPADSDALVLQLLAAWSQDLKGTATVNDLTHSMVTLSGVLDQLVIVIE